MSHYRKRRPVEVPGMADAIREVIRLARENGFRAFVQFAPVYEEHPDLPPGEKPYIWDERELG